LKHLSGFDFALYKVNDFDIRIFDYREKVRILHYVVGLRAHSDSYEKRGLIIQSLRHLWVYRFIIRDFILMRNLGLKDYHAFQLAHFVNTEKVIFSYCSFKLTSVYRVNAFRKVCPVLLNSPQYKNTSVRSSVLVESNTLLLERDM